MCLLNRLRLNCILSLISNIFINSQTNGIARWTRVNLNSSTGPTPAFTYRSTIIPTRPYPMLARFHFDGAARLLKVPRLSCLSQAYLTTPLAQSSVIVFRFLKYCRKTDKGVVRNLSRGGLIFFFQRWAQHPWGRKPPEIHRFHWSRPPQPPLTIFFKYKHNLEIFSPI